MNKSAEESIKIQQNFPLNQRYGKIHINNMGQSNSGEEQPYPLINQQNEIVINQT